MSRYQRFEGKEEKERASALFFFFFFFESLLLFSTAMDGDNGERVLRFEGDFFGKQGIFESEGD